MTTNDPLTAPSGITFRQLQIFVVTAEAGSITTAADQLYLSQTAVSLALRQLERSLGVTLMVRRRAHGITLTPTGRSLLPLGRNILSSVSDFGKSARDDCEVSGNVTIGCFPSLGPTMLPNLMEKFMIAHPQARVHFIEANHKELLEMLDVGSVDLLLTYRMGLPVGLIEQVVEVRRAGVLIGADHPLAQGRDSISLAELANEPYIMLESSVTAEHARHTFASARVYPEVRYTSMNFETIRSLAGRKFGWSLSMQRPLSTTTHEGKEVRVLELEDEQVPGLPVVAVRSPQLILSRAAAAFMAILNREYPKSAADDSHPDLLRQDAENKLTHNLFSAVRSATQ